MKLNYYSLYIIALVLITVNADAVSEFWSLTCNIIKKKNSFAGTTCSTLKSLYSVSPKNNNRKLIQIKPGQCAFANIPKDGYVEVCSSGGYRLYFDPKGYKVRGCYTMGEGNTKSFADCCQVNHKWDWNGHAWQEHWGEFCSGPHGNYKNPSYLKVKTITDGQTMKHTNKMTVECKKDWYSKNCAEMERRAKRSFTEPISWNGAKQF